MKYNLGWATTNSSLRRFELLVQHTIFPLEWSPSSNDARRKWLMIQNYWILVWLCQKSASFLRNVDLRMLVDVSQWEVDGNKRNLNCLYSISAKKHHFKCISKHRIIPRSCCLSGWLLLYRHLIFLNFFVNFGIFIIHIYQKVIVSYTKDCK